MTDIEGGSVVIRAKDFSGCFEMGSESLKKYQTL